MSNHSEALKLSNQLKVLKPQPIPPTLANIAECSIATDSVVATATVRTDATMRRIVVDWGMERSIRFGTDQASKQWSPSRTRCRPALTSSVMPMRRRKAVNPLSTSW